MKKKEYLQRKSRRVAAMALALLMSVSIFAQTLPKVRAEVSDADAAAKAAVEEIMTVEIPAEQTEGDDQISENVSLESVEEAEDTTEEDNEAVDPTEPIVSEVDTEVSATDAESVSASDVEEVFPAFNASTRVDGWAVNVSAPEGVLPENAELHVRNVSGKVEKAAESIVGSELEVVLDIALYADGAEIQPNAEYGSVTVSLTNSVFSNSCARLYHFNDNMSAVEDIGTEQSGSTVSVEVEHFSTFGGGTAEEPWLIGATDASSVKASFDSATGTLIISGSGKMMDWSSTDDVPWIAEGLTDQIKAVSISSAVTNIGDYAFSYSGLETADLSGIESIGAHAFEYAGSLKTVDVRNVTSIGERAFGSCDSLETLTGGEKDPVFPNLTTVGEEAFGSGAGMETVTAPKIEVLKVHAFYKTTLKSISMPGLKRIEDFAFIEIYGLKEFTIPAGVTYIGDAAFSYGDIERLFFETETMPEIDDNAFDQLNVDVFIPASWLINGLTLDKLNSDVHYQFSAFPKNTNVLYYTTFQDGSAEHPWLIGKDVPSDVTAVLDKKTNTLTISGSGEMIDFRSLSDVPWDKVRDGYDGSVSIENLIIESGVESIGKYAFSYMSGVKNVYYHEDTMPSVAADAFKDVKADVYFPDSWLMANGPTGRPAALANQQGSKYQFGGKLNYVGPDGSTTYPWYVGSTAPYNKVIAIFDPGTATLTISGSGDMVDYASSSPLPWNVYLDKDKCAEKGLVPIKHLTIQNGVNNLGAYTCYNDKALETVNIMYAQRIGDCSLAYTGITDVVFGNVKRIGDGAFKGVHITETDLTGVADIGQNAFESSDLTVVDVRQAESIGAGAFSSCSKLETLTGGTGDAVFPNLTSLGTKAFGSGGNMTSFTAPKLETVVNQAFADLTLENISVPKLKKIDDYGFAYIDGLKEVTIPAGVTSVGKGAFSDGDIETLYYETAAMPEMDKAAYDGLTADIYVTDTWLLTEGPSGRSGVLYDLNLKASYKGQFQFGGDVTYHGADGSERYPWYIGKDDPMDVVAHFDPGTGTLTISGSGEMTDFSSSSSTPWVNNINTGSSYAAYPKIKQLVVEKGVENIGSSSFLSAENLISADIEYVKRIGEYAFSETGLETADLSGIESIGAYAFEYAGSLKTVDVRNVTSIGERAFGSCDSLETLTGGEKDPVFPNLTTVGEEAFGSGAGMETVTAPKIEVLKVHAFYKTTLKSISMPGLKRIEDFAFIEIYGLKEFTIPAGVTYIGDAAFSYGDIERLFFETETMPEMHDNAFDQLNVDVFIPASWLINGLTLDKLNSDVHYQFSEFSDYTNVIYHTGFEISIDSNIKNGEVTVNHKVSPPGDEIVITATPDKYYELDSITATNVETSQPITVKENKFTMPESDVAITATFVESKADTTDLEAAVTAAKDADESDYTADVWEQIQDYINETKDYIGKGLIAKDAQEAIEKLVDAISDALDNKADMTDIDAALDEAEDITVSDYTTATAKDFADALSAAQQAKTDRESQAALDEAAQRLADAIDALKLHADTTALEDAVGAAKNAKQIDYPADVWSKIQELVEKAKDYANSSALVKDDVQDDIDELCADLVEALGRKLADYSDVTAALSKIPKNLSDYDADTVKALEDAQNAVVNGLMHDKQDEVDKFAEDLENALDALRIKGEKNLVSATAPATIYMGDNTQKIAIETASDGGKVTYTIEPADVADVDENGNITVLKAGSATIKVTAAGNDKYAERSIDIPVTVKKRTQQVTADDMTIADVDSGVKIDATVAEVAVNGVPALLGKTAKPVFASSDESIATVDENGVITVKKPGKVKISMTLPGNDYYDEVTVPTEFTLTIDELAVIEGTGGKYKVGSKDGLIFRSNGVYDNFLGVQVDGKDVDASNYTAWEGSTYVKFTTKYLDSLATGKHKLTYLFKNGKCDADFYVERPSGGSGDNPKTGDEANIILWANLLVLSMIVLAAVVIDRKKRGYSIMR